MPTNPDEPSFPKWLTIGVMGIVSIVVGVATALILDYLRTSAPKLEYEVLSSSTFLGQTQKIGMIAIELQNSGRKELELVTARIHVRDAQIIESKTEDFPSKGVTETSTKDTYSADIPFLNPSERGRILLLLNLATNDLAPPSIELRAKGVTGTQRITERSQKKQKIESLIAATAGGVSWLGFSMWVLFRRNTPRWAYTSSHRDDQRDVAAFVLDICGLTTEAHELRLSPRSLPFWSIADDLTQAALTKNDPDNIRKVICALETLMKYAAVTDTSCFLINYNLARLYNRLGDTEKAKNLLALSRKQGHAVIEKRIAMTDDLKPIMPEDLKTTFSKPRRAMTRA
jgi:hypothetical protein